MARTELDIFGIKERIVAILQNDTGLYTTTAESGKLRKIVAGWTIQDKVKPNAFITNSSRFETIIPKSVISNEWKTLTHELDFEIHLTVDGKTPSDAEEKLDDFRKLLYEVIEENNQLKNPSTGLDPLVSTSWFRHSSHQNRGELTQTHVYTLHCIVTS